MYILTLFLLATNAAKGQIVDKTLQKLIDNKLIEKKQVKDFQELLMHHEDRSGSVYLQSLFKLKYKQLTGIDYTILGSHLHVGDKPSSTSQSKINEELYLNLSKLQNCGLVTDRQFNDQITKIDENKYVHILQLLSDLADQSAYEEWLNPHRIVLYGEQLLDNHILSEQSLNNLKIDVNSGKITNHYQLVSYLDKAIFFDLAKYSNDPKIYLEQIHKDVSKLLPDLSFTEFNYKIEVDSTESFRDYTAHKVVISLKNNNKTYTQKSFISPFDIGKNGNFLGKIDSQEFYKIFNKILADNQSPYRLHEIKFNTRYFGIIMLQKSQVNTFRKLDGYLQVSYESFKNSLTSEQIVTAINEYQQIGLLKYLTASQIENSKNAISEQENKNLNEVLSTFPDVITTYDTELENLKDPYAELIRHYKRISHGEFNATSITDDFDIEKNKEVVVKFKIGNKLYRKTLKIEGDWIDFEFFDFIRSVVADQQLEGQFYELYTGGQEAYIIYLTKKQYDYLRTNRLLIFADEEWLSDEE